MYQVKQQPAVELNQPPPRGRHSAVRAGVLVFATYMRGQALSPTGERAAQIRMMVSQGRNRGFLPWVAFFPSLSVAMDRKRHSYNSPINCNLNPNQKQEHPHRECSCFHLLVDQYSTVNASPTGMAYSLPLRMRVPPGWVVVTVQVCASILTVTSPPSGRGTLPSMCLYIPRLGSTA